ncbi:MAG: FeoB-associated Cys-rich membrane protein [Christensenellaceae bacterium]|nr:FeoB-associated Cys-rich membrane protein [Christensenellaceae bacterium]
MKSIIVAVILLAIAAGIIIYLYKSKKRGNTCVGCPHSGQCSGGCGQKK